MALPDPKPQELVGWPKPRIGPPVPLRHGLPEYRAGAKALDIEPMPWQDTVATYLTALGPDDLWLYREVAAVVGRQNGKTTLVKPLIVQRLKAGRHIMHIAQVRELPRIMFEAIADALEETPELFPRRRGKIIWPRRGAGSESIVLTNGGSYRISAAVSGASRGHERIDDLLIDELREMDSFEVVNSAKPAQRFSDNPQTIYLSNMGTETSVVLNSLRRRAGYDAERGWVGEPDPSLAYLEWSADPEFQSDDRRGWVQANPSIGHYPQVLRDLETDYLAAKLGGNMSGFETEALCRQVPNMRQMLIEPPAWLECRDEVEQPTRPAIAWSMDPDGTRASVAIAWRQSDDTIALRELINQTGDPVDTDALGADLRKQASALGVAAAGFGPKTDAALAKFLKKPKPKAISSQEFANATAMFVNLVNAGHLRWADGDAITDDLTWTTRKHDRETGSFEAVRAAKDRPIPASLAAIRAVWLAANPPLPRPKVM